jgi:hypothetical protein
LILRSRPGAKPPNSRLDPCPRRPPHQDPNQVSRYKTRHLLSLFALITLAVGVANYAVLRRSQSEIIEHEALRLAEVVTDQAIT